ncbi:5558_t:CDS:2 [Funneliformis mosseae]|uniref:5558_t:CDS:1 n=1 Tax=Funneliformis mosseae TaxID=27381 RepID=A0A9N8ZUU1_FUNMO|nr:5558_t:CDS:2 [Funneliformis mosseae]
MKKIRVQKYVIPYLRSQQQAVIDKVVDSLFNRLPFLLDHDNDVNLKDILERTSFVPIGTYKMSQQQQMPARRDIVELSVEYTPLFKAIGVRNEIGNMDLILIIKNMVKDNRDRVFSEDKIERIIKFLKRY